MRDDIETTESNTPNTCLMKKRQRLIGDGEFIPASYLHLAHFWGYLTDKQFNKGKKYGKLRGLLDQAQGNYVVWSHKLSLDAHSRPPLTAEQEEDIEQIWKGVRNRITTQDMIHLDWLVHEALSYDWDITVLQERLKKYRIILERL